VQAAETEIAIQDDHDLHTDTKPAVGPNVPFMQMDEVYKMLIQPTSVLSKVPRGRKSNHWFVSNIGRMDAGKYRNFWDDCGIWRSGGSICKRAFVVDNEHLVCVKNVHGQFCMQR